MPMIIRKPDARLIEIPRCHDGPGEIECREYLGEYDRVTSGVKFVHDDLIPVGSGIGEHVHSGDEEVYVVLAGEGLYLDDGVANAVGAGDVCIVRNGHSHALTNTGTVPMRLIVVGLQC
jgi:mannose-6-phosphate isomerase-like protein (cupin superfamily)